MRAELRTTSYRPRRSSMILSGYMIEPAVLKGFRDSLPEEEIPKKRIIRILEDVFSSYGFVPIDTPVLEYTEVLLGKGGGETDKQIFRFQDNGGRQVAMRFDLTVPFARFLAMHHDKLGVPFKRYHINKVWRGENPQKGRYREFIQCDFDIVGADNAEADYEILSMMHRSFSALGIDGYTYHLSHRALFSAFLAHIGIEDKSIDILRTVDKMRKIGTDEVRKLLDEITGDSSKTEGILSFITAGDGRDFIGTLEAIEKLSGGPSEHSERMRTIYSMLEKTGIASSFVFDPSITRGLDYYTGIVYETFLDKLPSLGSVCSGGRYNDLASLYTKEKLPGVGSSIGLDRLMAGLIELGSPLLADSSAADVLIIHNADDTEKAVIAGEILRGMGIRTDIYLLPEAKMKRIYGYAEARHIPYSLQIKDGSYVLKNLGTREETSFDDLSQIREVIRID